MRSPNAVVERAAERDGRRAARPLPDEVELSELRERGGGAALRVLGAIAVLVVGAVHLQQYFGADFYDVSVIGPLFVLDFAGATLIGLGLLLPIRRVHVPLAIGGIGLAAASIVSLLISEYQSLFGFRESGYRTAVVVALAAEAAAVALLAGYVWVRAARR